MLSRPAIPKGAGWAFELKWDGLRVLVSTENELLVEPSRLEHDGPIA